MSNTNNKNFINILLDSKSEKESEILYDQILELEYINKIVSHAREQLKELKWTFDKEIKNFNIEDLNKVYNALNELSPHLFLKPETFRKEIVREYEIKFDIDELKEAFNKRDFSFSEKAFIKAKKIIVNLKEYEDLIKKLNQKDYHCKISVDYGDPMYGSYILYIDIFHKDNVYHYPEKAKPTEEEIKRQQKFEEIKKENEIQKRRDKIENSFSRRVLKIFNLILFLTLIFFSWIAQSGQADFLFWKSAPGLYYWLLGPSLILTILNYDETDLIKSFKNYKKYLMVHNATLIILTFLTIMNSSYIFGRYF